MLNFHIINSGSRWKIQMLSVWNDANETMFTQTVKEIPGKNNLTTSYAPRDRENVPLMLVMKSEMSIN